MCRASRDEWLRSRPRLIWRTTARATLLILGSNRPRARPAGSPRQRGARGNRGGMSMAIQDRPIVADPRWNEYQAEEYSDAVVQALKLGGVDYLFFVSGSEMVYFQESIAKG